MRWFRRREVSVPKDVFNGVRDVAAQVSQHAYAQTMQTNTAIQMLARAIADAGCRDKQFALPASFVESFRDGYTHSVDLGPLMVDRNDDQAIETLIIGRSGFQLSVTFRRRDGDLVQRITFAVPTPLAGP